MVLQASTCEPAQDSSRRRDMFQALEVPPELPRIDLAALRQIIHLAASTCGFGSSPPARRYWQNEEEGLEPFGP